MRGRREMGGRRGVGGRQAGPCQGQCGSGRTQDDRRHNITSHLRQASRCYQHGLAQDLTLNPHPAPTPSPRRNLRLSLIPFLFNPHRS